MKYILMFMCVILTMTACQSHKVPMVSSYQHIPVIQVRKNDTLYSLAKRYDTSVQELIRTNKIADPTELQTGQDLTLPKPIKVPKIYADKMPSDSDRIVQKPKSPSQNKKQIVKTSKQTTQIRTKPSQPKMKKLDKPFVAKGSVRFAWPLKGNVLSSFGAKGGGVKNDGINIGAEKGTLIRASEAGIVVYAGNELKGYGNLLLLRHEKGFMTAYAHADTLKVSVGQVVAQGEVIATVGTTGGVQKPQLHFEIRRKTKPVDPKKYLH